MKKLSVLLVAMAVAVSASAGVTKLVKSEMSAKQVKAKAELREANRFTRGSQTLVQGMNVQAMDWSVRPASHVLRDGASLFWDFETQAQADEWTMWDNDGDGYGWQYFNMTGVETGRMTPYSGEGLMASASYDNDLQIALYPDNWLISPVVTLNKTLSFYAAGQDAGYAAEKFSVYVCVGQPTGVNDFVQVGVERTATGSYTKYQYDLSEYAGQEGCIAIRHYNVTDMFWLNIDDVAINDDELEPEPEIPTVIYDIPEGCVVKTYWRNSACIYSSIFGIGQTATDGKFNIAFDEANGEVYVQNPSWWNDTYDTWVKGTYDAATGIITIPTGQYLMYSDYGYGIVLGLGSTYVYEEDGDTYMGYEINDRDTEFQMMVDGDNIYLLGTEGDVNAEFPLNYNATGLMTYYSDDLSMTALEFCYFDEEGNPLPFGMNFELAPAVPANPSADEWYDCGDETGYSRFYFTLPKTDVDGNMIDPSLLSYSIFIDNGNGPEIFHFTGDDYTFDLYPDDDITEVPYELYTNAVDFSTYYVYMYRTNMEGYEPLFTKNIGIQVYYTVDGERNASEIVWLYDTPVNVDELNAGKTVANVRYFNVAGQEVAQPEGMAIKVITYTDGTKSAVKVVK